MFRLSVAVCVCLLAFPLAVVPQPNAAAKFSVHFGILANSPEGNARFIETTSVPNVTLSNPAGHLQCLQIRVQRADGPKILPTDDLPTWSRLGCVQN